MNRFFAAIALAAAALATVPGVALADRVYHSEHIPFAPIGDAPLRYGFVENIHPNGPNVYAHEVYVLDGAEPATQYQVFLNIYIGDVACSGAPFALPTATIATNAAGNGRADILLTPDDAGPLRNATHGVAWTVEKDGVPVYETLCTSVTLD